MASNIDNKYRGAGWNKDKEIKYRNIEEFEKDLTEEKPTSKKTEKLKKEKTYIFEVEYSFNKLRFKSSDNSLIYNVIEFEARDKSEAKKKFDKWDKERKDKIQKEWKKDHPEDDSIFGGYFSHPEYFASITNIRKKQMDK